MRLLFHDALSASIHLSGCVFAFGSKGPVAHHLQPGGCSHAGLVSGMAWRQAAHACRDDRGGGECDGKAAGAQTASTVSMAQRCPMLEKLAKTQGPT